MESTYNDGQQPTMMASGLANRNALLRNTHAAVVALPEALADPLRKQRAADRAARQQQVEVGVAACHAFGEHLEGAPEPCKEPAAQVLAGWQADLNK